MMQTDWLVSMVVPFLDASLQPAKHYIYKLNEKTKLAVDMDRTDEFKDYFF